MILDAIRAELTAEAAKKSIRGNPTGSQLGTCSAQLQQQMWRDRIPLAPEPWQPRGVATTEFGRLVEEWLAVRIRKAITARGGIFGLRETTFYFPVPYPDGADDTAILAAFSAKIGERLSDRSRRLWGTVVEDFIPPKITYHADEPNPRKRWTIRGIGQEKDWRGLCLEPAKRTLWVPVTIDGAVFDPDQGLTVVEEKSMTSFGFRRAMLGDLDHRYKAQLTAALVATGFPSARWICVRRDTAHAVEIVFSKGGAGTIVEIIGLTGAPERYIVMDRAKGLLESIAPDGGPPPQQVLLDDTEGLWFAGSTWTPYDASILPAMYENVWRTVLSKADGPWHRQYGPDFTCKKCAGEGSKLCGQCKGTGVTAKLKKPCGPCGGAKRVLCEPCDGKGQLEETELPAFPCGYCSVALNCWAPAGVRREIDRRPHLFVTRAAYEASGLSFAPVGDPEAPAPEAEEVAAP